MKVAEINLRSKSKVVCVAVCVSCLGSVKTLIKASDVNDSGVVVGRYADANGTHGFVLNQGVFTSIDFPGAVLTVAQGINDLGQIVGSFQGGDAVDHGFVLSRGVFHQVDFPGSINSPVPRHQ
jgi:probable HAF family extracellular repeat protein